MFDKLIESNSAEAEFKPRRKFFMVSTVVVGILFLSAVIASLYAQEFDLGSGEFEMSMLLAPVTAEVPEPEIPREDNPQNTPAEAERPTRQANIARLDEVQAAPAEISTVPNTQLARPYRSFDLGTRDFDPRGGSISGIPNGTGLPGSSSANSSTSTVETEPRTDVRTEVPPPIIKKPATKTLGVVNGIATHLPKPPYPAAAISLHVEGEVSVQVTIDETGKVVSSKAAKGHPLLRSAAEKAAWNARFEPTTLSKVPVKVTGVIVYKFTRN